MLPAMNDAGRAGSDYVKGVWLVLISAFALAFTPTGARLAYDAGSNTLTVIALRGSIGVVLIAAGVAMAGGSFRLSRSAFAWCGLSGLFYALMMYGIVAAVTRLSVSLTILIYYTHPILLIIIAHFSGGEPLNLRKLLIAAGILSGLAIAIGADFSTLDLRGVALAFMASAAICGMILCNAKAQEKTRNELVNLYMTSVTAGIYMLITSFTGAWLLPGTAWGWIGILGAAVGLVAGLLTFFASFRYLSPTRATMISNVEPLFGILFAIALLGERLQPIQWLGALLVIAGLFLFELPARKQEANPA